MSERGRIRLGTSSWSESSWVGSFYPAGTAPKDQLALYAQRFSTVEADVTYYRVPSRAMVRGWRERTPEGFALAAKFPRSIVHGGDGSKPERERVLVWEHAQADTEAFLEHMSELGPKLGPLVLQFPYFNRGLFRSFEEFAGRLEAYLERLPKGRYAVELRNKDWIEPALFDLLARHGAALVLVDIAYMPHPAEWAERVGLARLASAAFAYARLIGDRAKIDALTERFDRIVLDQGARLERWAGLLDALVERVPETNVYANNHYAGHAPATLAQLSELLVATQRQRGPRAGGGPASAG